MRLASSVEDPDGVGRRVRIKVTFPGAGHAGISDLQVSMGKNVSEFWFSRRYTCRKRGKDDVFLVGSQGEKGRVGLMRWKGQAEQQRLCLEHRPSTPLATQ